MNLKTLLVVFLFSGFMWFSGTAQTGIDSLSQNVRVVRHYKLDLLQERFNKSDKVKGYRIQIHSGQRDEGRKAKSQFLRNYPSMSCYETYQQPYFNIQVGDFMTKVEARSLLNELRELFPNSFIVPDYIDPFRNQEKK